MDATWKRYLDDYANSSFYWYQPKGLTISPGNLAVIQKKLRLLSRFEGKEWEKSQRDYTKALIGAGLFKSRSARPGTKDFSAISRMNKLVLDSLGLAWTTDQSVVELTPVGREFLAARASALPGIVAQQLRRYLYPNPCVGRPDPGAGVFPYLALLQVVSRFPSGVPSECYELFISRIRDVQGIQRAAADIQRYRRLSAIQQADLKDRVDRLPIVRDGRVIVGDRRQGLLNTIQLNRSYMLGLLKTPGLVQEVDGALRIDPDRYAEAQDIVQDHQQQDCYIDFHSPEDWVAFYGQKDRRPTYEEAIHYYRSRGDVDRGTAAYRQGRSRNALPEELHKMGEGEFRKLQVLEKTLEDFLEFNLEIIEKGLRFVARQYRTSTGPLDILARDSKGRYVVIELKKGRAADRVIGQLLRYIGFIRRERASGKARSVRGFVVAPDPDCRLIAAAGGATEGAIEVFRFVVRGQAARLYPR